MKVALVTGSARGIGNAIAKTLLKNEYYTYFSDVISQENSEEILKSAREISQECDYIKCDISNADDRVNVFSHIMKEQKRLDVLVNNAGVAPLVRQDLLNTTEESFDRVLGINLKGTFYMCQHGAKAMLESMEQHSGMTPKIVNISSCSAYTSSPNRPEYCISKAGIAMVTKLFGDRFAETPVRVFEVRPGIIASDMTSSVTEKYEKLIAEGVTPIKRFGQPQDVADMVLAACSGLLDFTVGQVLNADGGFHLQRL